jgi:PKD repeat protein
MMKFNCSTSFSLLLCFFLTFTAHSQTNRDSIKGIINSYAQVTTFGGCDAKLTVSDTTGFRKGMRVILCQMNGATIKTTNNSDFGNFSELRNVGNYEVNVVDSVAANTLFLGLYLKNEYDAGTAIQVVTYPYFASAVVTDTLKAKAWDGLSGGFIAFEAGTLELKAPIIATAVGFRGGVSKAYPNCDAFEFYNDYFYDINTSSKQNGAPKGESIAAFIAGKECGRGAQGNGGGGGNNHKSGGGGGGHISGGGIGGKQNHVSDIRNCYGNWPGGGGNLISSTPSDKIFFGGGGGAGHRRESSSTRGGHGGGVIIIKANTLTTNGHKIVANGENGLDNTSDGGGGGGAGGTIILLATQTIGTSNLENKGGAGSNTGGIQEYDFGPGGGGSAGRIIINNTTGLSTVLTGGLAGKNAVTRSEQGAEKGGDGLLQNIATFKLPISTDTVYRTLKITEQPVAVQICEYQTTTFSVKAQGTNLSYEWQVNKGNGFIPVVADTTFIGVGTATLIINKARTALNSYLFRCVIIGGCAPSNSINSQSVSINILPAPVALFTPVITYNTVQFNNTSTNSTTFIWSFGDGRTGRSRDTTITYSQQGEYDVTLKAINTCDTITYMIRIKLNALPKAGYTSTTTSYCTPANVQFTNTSSNNTVSYKWLFDGGVPATSTDISPSVLYPTPGTYDVVLIAINGNGRDTLAKTGFIKVNAAPIANFRKIQNGNNPIVSFENLTVGATTFAWDFGDGMAATEANPQHTYTSGGTFIVKLTVSNNCGSTSKLDTIIFLSRPSATIAANQPQGCSPFLVQFTGRNAANVGTWAWSFPGGTPSTSTLPSPRITYNTEGIFSVSLKVSNAAGIYETTQSDYIKVQASPKADFDFVVNGAVVKFTNKSTNAASYKWDFDDLTTSNVQTPPDKTYRQNGNYNVTLQALNPYCGSAIVKQVTIFVVGTKDDKNTEGVLSVFPNPTDGKLFLSFENALTTDFQLVISNTNGQVVKKTALTREAIQTLDLAHLAQGVYFLQFSNDKERFVKRVIKL